MTLLPVRSVRAILVALVFSTGPLSTESSAATVPGEFPTIQAAINAVLDGRLPNGTTIDIQPGVYREALLIANSGRSLTLRGMGGAGAVFVDASGRGAAAVNVFRMTGQIVFMGLTFRNAAVPTAAGGGFVIQDASPTFIDSVFESNSAIDGGGGALIHSNATFIGCVIRNNWSGRFGGGVLIVSGSRPIFTRCDIVGNASGTGGAGVANNGAGGGVHSNDSSPSFRGCRISSNSSKFAGGGIYHAGGFGSPNGTAWLLVEDSEVADNVSTRFSSAENPAEGGGIHIEDNAVAHLVRARILRNRANTGGGLNAYRARYNIFDSTVEANFADGGMGGGISAMSSSPAPSPARPRSVVTLTNTLVRNNTGTIAGGIVVGGDSYCGGSTPTCTSNNKATLSLVSSVVDGNQSATQGGGILVDRTDLAASNSLVIRNRVSGGPNPFGGGILVDSASSASLNGVTIAQNTASQWGGGLFLNNGVTVQITGSRIYDNVSSNNGGGGVFVGNSGGTPSGTIQNSVIADNAGYQIREHTCPRTTLVYNNNTITPRSGSTDLFFSGCQNAGPTTSISSFNGLQNTSGNNSNVPQFAHFVATPGIGATSTLAWSVARATSVTIAGVTSSNQKTGTVDVAPGSSMTFSLTAQTHSGSIGPVTAALIVARAWGAQTDTPVPADYDGDGRADLALYRGSSGQWFLAQTRDGMRSLTWGAPHLGDMPVPADYDGDRRADVAVYRMSSGEWFVARSTGGMRREAWGAPSLGDVPIPADYDGDGRTDVAVYRSTTGEWFIARSSGGMRREVWGAPSLGDAPVPADYDGDGRADVAVYRATTGEWFISRSTGGMRREVWGAPSLGDVPVPADYDGDRRADVAVARLLTGEWFVSRSRDGALQVTWGVGDARVPADFDGNGAKEIAIWRAASGSWLIR